MRTQIGRKVYQLSGAQIEVMHAVEALYIEAVRVENAEPYSVMGNRRAQFRRRVADRLRNEVLQEAMAFHMGFN